MDEEPKGYFFLLPPKGLLGKEVSETDFYLHPAENMVSARIYHRGHRKNKAKTNGTYGDPRVFQYWGALENFITAYSTDLAISDWPFLNDSTYEIVPDTARRRLFFDVDYKLDDHSEYPSDFFSQVLYQSISYLQQALLTINPTITIDIDKWGVYDSSTSSKISFHLLPDWTVQSAEENKKVTLLANKMAQENSEWIYPNLNRHWFDIAVYGSKQNYRMIYSSKPGGNNPKIPVKEWRFQDYHYRFTLPPRPRNLTGEYWLITNSMVLVNPRSTTYPLFLM